MPVAMTFEKEAAVGLTSFAGQKLAKYAGSKLCQAVGITKKHDYDAQLSEIIAGQQELEKKMEEALEKLDYIMAFQAKLYAEMEKDKFQNSVSFFQDIDEKASNDWNLFVNAVGSNNTLDDLAKDGSALAALERVLTNQYLANLTIQSDLLAGTGRDSHLKNLLSSKDSYLASISPEQGKKGNDLVDLLDRSNEAVMKRFYDTLNALQCTYVIQKTALYLKYHSSNEALKNITLSEAGILNSNSFDTNDGVLEKCYSNKFDRLAAFVSQSIISDGNPDETGKPARSYPGVPKGTWTESATLYAWSGLAEGENAYSGRYDGMELKVRCEFNGVRNESTLNLADAYSPATERLLMAQTKKPYLVCEFLTQNGLPYTKDYAYLGGYCDSYGGHQMKTIEVASGIVIYGSAQHVVVGPSTAATANYTLLAPKSSQARIDQFLQINFPNNERALFQLSRGSWKLLWDAGVVSGQWTNANSGGKEPKSVAGGWAGGGNSTVTVTSFSKEKSAVITVSGKAEGKNYTTPILSLNFTS